jgi:hypothetical protein
MVPRLLTIAIALLFATACEKTNHENIDKWVRTQKGPGKLKKAVTDEGIDADLSAHAAANLLKMQHDPDVRTGLEKMSPGRRQQVLAKLTPRLWDMARIESETTLPNGQQIAAKDMLLETRKYADDAGKQQIDGYLTDWYAVTSYEARAGAGATLGPAVMRLLGPNAGKKLMGVANSVLAAPGQDKVKNRIGDELMLGLAASGNTEAVKFLLDLVKLDRGDPTQGKRAMSALFKAYVDSSALFDIASPEPLVSSLDQLVGIAKDDQQPGQVINDAIALIRAVGPPACFAPLVGMVKTPHRESRFKYLASSSALKCGGPKSIPEVLRALPDQGAYVKEEVQGSISGEIAKMSPPDQVKAGLRELLADRSTVARWVAIEALAAMKSVEDAPKIAALSGNRDKLVGFWGEDNPENKPDPTLGQRAKELSDGLTKAELPK